MEGIPSPPAGLSSLPPELGDYIASFLTNRDIKSLRLTSSSVCRIVTLRLQRVFIGANPRNIQVAYEVANHETFRTRVQEIIWDGTYLGWDGSTIWENSTVTSSQLDWYTQSCRNSIALLGTTERWPGDVARMRQLAAAMGPVESIEIYKELLRGQNSVLESGADIKAFEYTLNRFTSLRRVTISNKTHGRLFMPVYQTPMIRSFPYGFVYTLPRLILDLSVLPKDKTRKTMDIRSVRSTLRALAKHGKHNVSEFILDDEMRFSIGLDDKTTLADLYSLVQRPGFRRLHLRNMYPIQAYKLLEKAENLQSLYFRVSDYDPSHRWDFSAAQASGGVAVQMNTYLEFPMPLSQSLQNLAITGYGVDADSLATALAPLAYLRSLELRSVSFYHWIHCRSGMRVMRSRNARDFLYALRDKTDWRSRPLRPKVTIIIKQDVSCFTGKLLKIDSEVNKFLYKDGENPFLPVQQSHEYPPWHNIVKMCSGKGVWIDELDPECERPNYDDDKTLERCLLERRPLERRLHHEQNLSIYEFRRPDSWRDGPWGPRTCPTLEEQGINPDCGGQLE
ncbi:hypothetical protein HYE68_000341 [Fusarium pseudograminearum]|nr:hypothetical protein HYE68_000341 [Fusarium pseudograminearum]